MTLRTAPLRTGDDDDVRCIFRATLALGRPLDDVRDAHLRPYEDLCLGWYLGEGRSAASVLRDGRRVVGYALACTDPRGFARWQRRQVARFLARIVPRVAGLVSGRRDAGARTLRRFYRLRVRDGWDLWRADAVEPGLPHAHFNALPDAWRAGPRAGRLLADSIDAVVAAAGFDRWYGEINARSGRRAAAIARWGGEVVARQPNRTLSWLTGTPVERLTVVRRIPEAVLQAA